MLFMEHVMDVFYGECNGCFFMEHVMDVFYGARNGCFYGCWFYFVSSLIKNFLMEAVS